eukprot:jgi/Mesen1/6997/ME000365S06134
MGPTLGLLGLDASRLVSHDVYALQAIVAEAPCRAPVQPREILYMRRLRAVIRSRLRASGAVPRARERGSLGLVILCQNKWHRRVANLDLLVTSLRSVTKRQIVVLEDNGDVDASNLWPLFYQADLVVGPHGSGLVNIIACRAGTAVLEFMQPWSENGDPANANIAFEVIATSLGMPHYVVVPQYVDPSIEGKDDDSRFIVDVKKVTGYVSRILKEKDTGHWKDKAHVLLFESG